MSHPGFKVTVEDLESGETQAMVVYPGDYMLIPFEPCHRAGVQLHANGTHVITIKGHSPQSKPHPAPAVPQEERSTDE